jgi:hypothetical protein
VPALDHAVPALHHAVRGPRASGVWDLPTPDTYLHAVATKDGLRLDEHLTDLLERPPVAQILTAEIPAKM